VANVRQPSMRVSQKRAVSTLFLPKNGSEPTPSEETRVCLPLARFSRSFQIVSILGRFSTRLTGRELEFSLLP
jgi:hypothetical protein